MATHVIAVRVVEAALRESGDGRGRVGQNVINVALLWPRPGRSEVLGTTGLVPLTDHHSKEQAADTPPLFDALILKETVEGDCALLVQVLDRDDAGKFARFFLALASAGVEALGGAAAGAAPGFLRHVFSEGAENGAVLLGSSGRSTDRLDVIAVGARPLVLTEGDVAAIAEKGKPRRIEVALAAPMDMARPGEKGSLAPGRPNGHLVLEVSATRR